MSYCSLCSLNIKKLLIIISFFLFGCLSHVAMLLMSMGLPIFIRCVATLWCCLVAEASRRLWVAYWHTYTYYYSYAPWRGRTESNRTLPSDTCPRREEARRASPEKGSLKWGTHLVFAPSGPYATISLLSRPPTYLSFYSIRICNHQHINYFASYFQVDAMLHIFKWARRSVRFI